MKNNVWGVIAVWLGIVVVVCAVFGVGYYAVGVNTRWFGEYDYDTSRDAYNQSFEAALYPGDTLEVDLINPSVEVLVDPSLHDAITARFEGSRRGGDLRVVMEETSRGIRFRCPEESGFIGFGFFLNNRLEGKLTVYVPSNADIAYDISTTSGHVAVKGLTTGQSLSISSVSGAIGIEDVTAGDTDIATTSGRISAKACALGDADISSISASVTLESVTVGDLSASTTSGRIDLQGDACGDLSVSSMSGSVSAEYARTGNVDANTTSGRIAMSVASDDVTANSMSGSIEIRNAASGDMDIDTTSGAVRVIVPSAEDAALNLGSMSGSVTVDGRRMGNQYRTSSGRGEVSINTMSGSIRVESE